MSAVDDAFVALTESVVGAEEREELSFTTMTKTPGPKPRIES